MPTVISSNKNSILKKIELYSDESFWCVTNNNERIAYTTNNDSIIVVSEKETIYINSGFAEIIAWKDDNHLLYAKIIVEGMGDFYYDLYEYDIQTRKNRKIMEHLFNIYDYYDDIMLYSTTANKLSMTKMKGVESIQTIQIDLSSQMEWIYSAYILNTAEIIIGGDRKQSDCHYFKCFINDN